MPATAPMELLVAATVESRGKHVDSSAPDGSSRGSPPPATVWPIALDHAARLAGRSVLLIGHGAGSAACRLADAGAASVTAVESDPAVAAAVNREAAESGQPVVCRFGTADGPLPRGRFDVVIARDVLHRSFDPLGLLHSLCGLAADELLIEEPRVDDHGLRRNGLRRWLAAAVLDRLPVIWVSPYRANRADRRRFYFGFAAIERLLRVSRPDVESVHSEGSTTPGFALTRIRRRRIGELIVIAGPGSVGKTTLIDSLTAPGGAETGRSLHIGDLAGVPCADSKLVRLPAGPVPRAILHYDIATAFGSPPMPYEIDEALRLTRAAQRVRIVTLWAEPAELLRRLGLRIARQPRGISPRQRLQTQIYSDPASLRRAYERWFAYCDALGAEHHLIDVTADLAVPLGVEAWRARATELQTPLATGPSAC